MRPTAGKRERPAGGDGAPAPQWWTAESFDAPERPVGAGVALMPVILGAALSVLGLILLPVLLVGVTLGTADYAQSRTGAVGPVTFAVANATLCALAVAAGCWLTGARLRRADVERRAARRLAGLTGTALTVLLVGHGLAVGRPVPAAVAGLLFAGITAAWLGALLGVGTGRRRPRSGRG